MAWMRNLPRKLKYEGKEKRNKRNENLMKHRKNKNIVEKLIKERKNVREGE